MRIKQKLAVGGVSLWVGLAVSLFSGGCSSTAVQSEPKKELTHTERSRMLVGVANGALLEGDATGALQNLLQAEKEDSNLPELHHSKALAFYAKRDLKTALDSVRRALKLNPNYTDAKNTLGKILMESGQLDTAVPIFEEAAHDPLYRDAYKAWTNLGVLRFRQGKYGEARSYLNRAIENSPERSCVAFFYRGQVHSRQNQLTDAIKDYGNATKRLCASYGDAYFALGVAYQQNHQFDLARKTFLEIQKRYPNTQLAEKAMDQLKFLP